MRKIVMPLMQMPVILLVVLSGFILPCNARQANYDTVGVKNNLPVFYGKLLERQDFPLSWLNQKMFPE